MVIVGSYMASSMKFMLRSGQTHHHPRHEAQLVWRASLQKVSPRIFPKPKCRSDPIYCLSMTPLQKLTAGVTLEVVSGMNQERVKFTIPINSHTRYRRSRGYVQISTGPRGLLIASIRP